VRRTRLLPRPPRGQRQEAGLEEIGEIADFILIFSKIIAVESKKA
jgi:hypothetical protein